MDLRPQPRGLHRDRARRQSRSPDPSG